MKIKKQQICKVLIAALLTPILHISFVYALDQDSEWAENSQDALNPTTMQFLFQNYQGAINSLTEDIKRNPKLAELYFKRAIAKFMLKDYKAAMADFDKSIQISAEQIKAMKTKASAAGDFNAQKNLQIFLRNAYYYRGLTKWLLKKKPSACEDIKKAADLGREDASQEYTKYCAPATKP